MSGYTWVWNATSGHVPPKALECGLDSDGSKIYVGRANFQGDQLPCKVVPQRREAYVSHGGREHNVSSYELLCKQELRWIRSSNGRIPAGAVPGGRTSSGETLYIGKVRHGNAETIGKVHPSHRCLYIPYGGNEIPYKNNYEILVMQ